MEALGFPAYRSSSSPSSSPARSAGLAGALLGQPARASSARTLLHWTQSGTLMVMVILGGVGHAAGAASLGAAVLLLLRGSAVATTRPTGSSGIGWVLLAVVLFARQGLSGSGAAQARRGMSRRDRRAAARRAAARQALRRPGRDRRRRPATCDAGEIHALIGPNGAGKTTLIHQLVGPAASPTRGTIVFDGARHHRAGRCTGASRRGLARSFQITSMFRELQRARQRRARGAGARAQLRFWRRRARPGCSSARASCSTASASAPRRCASPARCRMASSAPLEVGTGAGQPAAAAAARRADGRHGAARNRRAWSR